MSTSHWPERRRRRNNWADMREAGGRFAWLSCEDSESQDAPPISVGLIGSLIGIHWSLALSALAAMAVAAGILLLARWPAAE